MQTFKQFLEDAPTNMVGGGNIAGTGVGADGEPGVTKSAMTKYKRKNIKNAPKGVIMDPLLRRKFIDRWSS